MPRDMRSRYRSRRKQAHKSKLNLNNRTAVRDVIERYVSRPGHRGHRILRFNFVAKFCNVTYFGVWHLSLMGILTGLGITFFSAPYGVVYPPDEISSPSIPPPGAGPEFRWTVCEGEEMCEHLAMWKPRRVAVFHMSVVECKTADVCARVILQFERVGRLPYNFVISPDGHIFSKLGWKTPSPIFFDEPTLVITFLGHGRKPNQKQYDQLHRILKIGVDRGYLDSSFIMYPTNLNRRIKRINANMNARSEINVSTARPEVHEPMAWLEINESTAPPEINKSTAWPVLEVSTVWPEINESIVWPEIDGTTVRPEINKSIVQPELEESTVLPEIYESVDWVEVEE